jgi:hypothetical protein
MTRRGAALALIALVALSTYSIEHSKADTSDVPATPVAPSQPVWADAARVLALAGGCEIRKYGWGEHDGFDAQGHWTGYVKDPPQTVESRSKALTAQFPSATETRLANLVCQRIWIGMTAAEARASWGVPSGGVNRTATASGTHEQWVYNHFWPQGYLYFDDGVLTAIQN